MAPFEIPQYHASASEPSCPGQPRPHTPYSFHAGIVAPLRQRVASWLQMGCAQSVPGSDATMDESHRSREGTAVACGSIRDTNAWVDFSYAARQTTRVSSPSCAHASNVGHGFRDDQTISSSSSRSTGKSSGRNPMYRKTACQKQPADLVGFRWPPFLRLRGSQSKPSA